MRSQQYGGRYGMLRSRTLQELLCLHRLMQQHQEYGFHALHEYQKALSV